VDPAPVRPAAEALAVDTAAIPPTDPATVMKSASNLLRIKVILSARFPSLGLPESNTDLFQSCERNLYQ
jgi:hypothetical protein